MFYIGEKSSEDWGYLIDFSVSPPEPDLKLYEVPGRIGAVDMSESLTGWVNYKDREIELLLRVIESDPEAYRQKISEIVRTMHGKRLDVSMSDDMGYFYRGRWSVEEKKNDALHGDLTIKGIVEPYAIKKASMVVPGSVNGTKTITLTNNGAYPVAWEIETDKELTIELSDRTLTMNAGTHSIQLPRLPVGNTEVKLTGVSATYAIEWQEGKL